MTKISDERLAELDNSACDQIARHPDGLWSDMSAAEAHSVFTELQSIRSQPEPAGVRVKGLEWVGEEGLPGRDISAEPTPEIRYTVRHLDMDTFDVILNTDLGSKWFRNDGEIHASYAQAKAAAQADYERRILSALQLQKQESGE